MRRCDLHRTRTELHARSFTICDDRNATVRQRKRNLLAVKMKVARVGRIDRNRRVAQQRLGTRRSHHQPLLAPSHRVGDVPEEPILFLLLHLEVAQHRLASRVPVYQPVVLVDEPLLPEPHKDLAHRLRQTLVHREPLARPVEAGTEPTQLHRNPVPILLLPKPGVLEEGLTTHLPAIQPALLQVTLHHHLRRDARVVGAGQPECLKPAHPLPADQHILNRVRERVPHVQRPSHIRRRDHDGVGRLVGICIRLEGLRGHPALVPARLNLSRIVSLRKLAHRPSPSRPCRPSPST